MTDIVDVLASLDAWSQQPVRILNWSVKRPRNDANRTTVAVRSRGRRSQPTGVHQHVIFAGQNLD
jgi:hypothetical protein